MKRIIVIIWLSLASCVYAQEWSNEEIVNAIFKAEGGYKAQYLFGIRSIKCEGYENCRQICYNTVRNNRKRFKEYGYKDYDTFLEFLASRYAPIGVSNDPKGLNKNWLKNVRFFLSKGGRDERDRGNGDRRD